MSVASILARTVRVDACLIWQGAIQSSGYASVTGGRKGLTLLAHRRVYELKVGPIPADMTVDHLCGQKLCLNVEHMEVVTRSENSRRKNARQTHCKHGHPLSGDNLHLRVKPSTGYAHRSCRACGRTYMQEYRERLSAELRTNSERGAA